jgi:hypothetical protein
LSCCLEDELMNGRMLVSMAVVVMLAGYDAGPRCMGEFRFPSIWGADPMPKPDCNGIDLGSVDCPFSTERPSVRCGTTYLRRISAPVGGLQTRYYVPDGTRVACRGGRGCPPDMFHDKLSEMECNPVKVTSMDQ